MSRVRPGRVTPIGAGIADTSRTSESSGAGRVMVGLLWAVALAAVVLGLNRLEPLARGLSAKDTRIEWVNLPAWLNDSEWSWLPAQLAQIPDFDTQTDIFDRNVTAYVGEQLVRSPWIERIDRVAKLADGRVRVYAHFRKPFTMIEKDGWAYLVDDAGVRLPGKSAAADVDHTTGLTISGARASAPSEGDVWPGQDVQDGIKLVRFLWQAEVSGALPVRPCLRSVDVSNFDKSKSAWAGQLRIMTRNPAVYVHWGMAPHEEYNIEAPAATKLESMCQETKIRPWFDQDRPIDVRSGYAEREAR